MAAHRCRWRLPRGMGVFLVFWVVWMIEGGHFLANADENVAKRTNTSVAVNTKRKSQDADADIQGMLTKIARMKSVGEQVASTILELADQIASADVHVNVSSALWNIDIRQDKRAKLLKLFQKDLNSVIKKDQEGIWELVNKYILKANTTANVEEIWPKVKDMLKEQTADVDILKTFVRKLHRMSLQHASLIRKVRQSLVRLLSTLQSTHNSLNITKARISILEKMRRKADAELKLASFLNEAKIDYETGMLTTRNGSTNVSLEQVRKSVSGTEKFKDHLKSISDPAQLNVDFQLLVSLLFLIGAAAIGGMLAARGGLPVTFGFILGGIVVGPSGLNMVANIETMQTLAQVGSILIFFQHGIRFRTGVAGKSHMAKEIGKAVALTSANMGITAIFAWIVFEITSLTHSALESLIVAMAIGSSSLSMAISCGGGDSSNLDLHVKVIDKSTTDAKEKAKSRRIPIPRHPFGNSASEVVRLLAVTSDGLISISLSVIVNEAGEGILRSCLAAMSALGCVIAIVILLEKFSVGMALRLGISRAFDSPQLTVLLKVTFSLASAVLTKSLGLSFEIGAFFAGLIVARFETNDIGSVSSVFGGILFTSMGTIISPKFVGQNVVLIFAATLSIYFLKLGSALVALKDIPLPASFSDNRNTRLKWCSALTGIGELSLVFVAQGQKAGVVTRRNYLLFLTVAVLSGLCFPYAHSLLFSSKTPTIKKGAPSNIYEYCLAVRRKLGDNHQARHRV